MSKVSRDCNPISSCPDSLVNFSHNTEKVIYFLLLERKRRKPATEDEEEPAKKVEAEPVDPPKKRLDATRLNGSNNLFYGQISEGSPLTPRRQAFK